MTTTDNTFTPGWKHGHEIVRHDGTVLPFIVKVWDWPGRFPIRGHVKSSDLEYCFDSKGMRPAASAFLRNAPAPKPKPREWWVNLYPDFISAVHETREAADQKSAHNRLECVLVREVIEPEGGA